MGDSSDSAGGLPSLSTGKAAAVLELGSLLIVAVLFIATVSALQAGFVGENETTWLSIIGIGVLFVVFWTVIYPLYTRYS